MPDYGLLGGLAQGLQAGMGAYQDQKRYQDQKMKEALERRDKAKFNGYDIGSDNGLVATPEKESQTKANIAKSEGEAAEYSTGEAGSTYGTTMQKMAQGKTVSPEEFSQLNPHQLEKIQSAAIAHQNAESAKNRQQSSFSYRDENSQNKIDTAAHQKTVQAIRNDPMSRDRVKQFQNLSNSLALIDKAKNLTPQQVHEFQQAVRKSLNIGGGGGVGEREETYIKSLGLNFENMKQFLTGDPANIAKDNKIVEHIRDLAHNEQDNVKGQIQDQLDLLSEGNSSMYERRPDLKSDLDKLLKASGKRAGLNYGQPQGLVNGGQQPSGGGMIPSGLIGGASAAQPAPGPSGLMGAPQNGAQSQPEMKVIQGVKYQKVQGGWQAVQ